MNDQINSKTHDGPDPYAKFAPDPNEDIGMIITAHRGGGGSFGDSGINIVDTMSTEIRGTRRRMTESEGQALHEAARSIARILTAIRTET